MKKAVETTLKKSPETMAQFRSKGIPEAQRDLLAVALNVAHKTVKDTLTIPLRDFSQGSPEDGEGDFTVMYEPGGLSDGFRKPLVVGAHSKAKVFTLSSFDQQVSFSTIKGLIGGLTRFPQLLKKGMQSLESVERKWVQGQLTPEDVVRKVVSAEASFDGVDEWLDTDVRAVLMLSTKRTIPQALLRKWVTDHWSEILAKLKKTKPPRPNPGRQRGRTDEWDEPRPDLRHMDPSMIRIRDAQIDVGQTGNRALAIINYAVR